MHCHFYHGVFDPTTTQRGQIITYVLDHPNASPQAVANQFNVHRTTISRILRRFRNRGVTTDADRSGRPHSLSKQQLEWLDNYIHTHSNFTSDRITNELNQHFNINVSSRTVRRLRKILGYHARQRGTYEAPTAQHKQHRIQWCNNHENTDWRQCVFVDESTIVLRDTGDIEWVKRGDPSATTYN